MMNNKITEMKNTLEGINSRITEAEEQISEVEITATEQKKRMKRNEDSIRDFQDIKGTNIRIIGVPEENEKEKGSEKISEEITVENFPNIEKEIVTQVQEVQSPIQDKPKEKHTNTHINQTTKIKYKEKILKAEREKQQQIGRAHV